MSHPVEGFLEIHKNVVQVLLVLMISLTHYPFFIFFYSKGNNSREKNNKKKSAIHCSYKKKSEEWPKEMSISGVEVS